MNKIVSLSMLLVAGYFIVQAVRFVIEMIRAPRGTFTDALQSAEVSEETCWSSPRERERYREFRR